MANSPARVALDVGSVIADTYIIEALVGRGGMGAVFLASHKRLPGKQVAIKLLHAELLEEEVLARFRREAEIASRLGHPNIVTVHDFNITSDGTPYLVLEYLQGQSLAQRLRTGPLPLDQILSIVRQVGSALAAAHREGIVHRDLKPQNIFLVPTEVDGQLVEIAKVLDFGISKIRGSQTVKTQESMLLGTPQYMAPEQAKGEHANCDERTDVFAFGAIVYEMLCGHPAFQGASIPEVVFKVVYEEPMPITEAAPGVPPAIALAVNQAMAKSAAARFSNVSLFVEAMTGQAVSQFRVPAVLPIEPGQDSGSRPRSVSPRSTGSEAFANTMGSGDHGGAVAATAAANAPAPSIGGSTSVGFAPSPSLVRAAPAHSLPPSVVAPLPPVIANAMTVKSHSGETAPPRRRSRALLVGLAVAGLGAAAIVGYFATRHDPAAPVKTSVAVAGDGPITPDAPQVARDREVITDASVAVPVIADAAVANLQTDAAVVAVKKPPERGRGSVPPPEPPEPPDDPDDKVSTDLRQAESELGKGKLDTAERYANAVINSPANPRQLARAHAIRGAVQCSLHNNEERAQIDLRTINARFRGARQALLAACHARGFLESIQR